MNIIRGLTLHRPWSWAIAHGDKRCENRTWLPPVWLIGQWLAIHGGLACDEDGMDFVNLFCARDPAEDPRVDDVGIVCVARLETVRTIPRIMPNGVLDIWFSGPYGWYLGDVRTLAEPIARPGSQGLWKLTEDEMAEVAKQTGIAVGGGQ